MPVGAALAAAASTCLIGIAARAGVVGRSCTRDAATAIPVGRLSTTVPHDSQSPQRPAHFALRQPHAVHSNTVAVADLAMARRYRQVLTLGDLQRLASPAGGISWLYLAM